MHTVPNQQKYEKSSQDVYEFNVNCQWSQIVKIEDENIEKVILSLFYYTFQLDSRIPQQAKLIEKVNEFMCYESRGFINQQILQSNWFNYIFNTLSICDFEKKESGHTGIFNFQISFDFLINEGYENEFQKALNQSQVTSQNLDSFANNIIQVTANREYLNYFFSDCNIFQIVRNANTIQEMQMVFRFYAKFITKLAPQLLTQNITFTFAIDILNDFLEEGVYLNIEKQSQIEEWETVISLVGKQILDLEVNLNNKKIFKEIFQVFSLLYFLFQKSQKDIPYLNLPTQQQCIILDNGLRYICSLTETAILECIKKKLNILFESEQQLQEELNQTIEANFKDYEINKGKFMAKVNSCRKDQEENLAQISYPIGILNEKNECYLNSLIQVVFATHSLRNMLLQLRNNYPFNDNSFFEESNPNYKNYLFLRILIEYMESLNCQDKDRVLELNSFKDQLLPHEEFQIQYSQGVQQCLDEVWILFQGYLIDSLKILKNLYINLLDQQKQKQINTFQASTLIDYSFLSHFVQQSDETNNLYEFQEIEELVCKNCSQKMEKLISPGYLNLKMASFAGLQYQEVVDKEVQNEQEQEVERISFLDLILQHYLPNSIEGAQCQNCKESTVTLIQQVKPFKLAPYLRIQISPNQSDYLNNIKIQLLIKNTQFFHSADLSLSLEESHHILDQNARYHLYAIVCHCGTNRDQGHYTVFARNLFKKGSDVEAINEWSKQENWFEFDDENIVCQNGNRQVHGDIVDINSDLKGGFTKYYQPVMLFYANESGQPCQFY